LHPGGQLEPAAYKLIGRCYQFVKEREPWLQNAKNVPYAAIVAAPDDCGAWMTDKCHSLFGLSKILLESHIHFDIIDETQRLEQYKLVLLPENLPMDASLMNKLQKYLGAGGNVIAVKAGQNASHRHIRQLEKMFGITFSPDLAYHKNFIRVTDSRLRRDIPMLDHFAEDTIPGIQAAQAASLASVVYHVPGVDETKYYAHAQPPAAEPSQFSAVTLRAGSHGGNAGYLAVAFPKLYYSNGNPFYRKILARLIDLVIPEKDKLLKVKAPLSVEVSLMEQKNRLLVHLVNYHAEKAGQARTFMGDINVIEEIPSISGIEIDLKVRFKPRRVYCAPSGRALKYQAANGRLRMKLPRLDIYEIVVIEK